MLGWPALALVAVAALAVAWQFFPVGAYLEAGVRWIARLGVWGVALFLILYVLLGIVGAPIIPLNIAAGILFGLGLGFATGLIAASATAMICFVLARTWASAWVEKRLAGHPRFAAMLAAIEHGGWRMVLLIRIMPLVPVVLKNYGFGLTHLRPREYFVPMVLSLAPNVLIYSYLGSIGYLTLSGGAQHPGPWQYALYAAVGIGAVGCAVGILLLARREMDRHMRQPPESSATVPPPPSADH